MHSELPDSISRVPEATSKKSVLVSSVRLGKQSKGSGALTGARSPFEFNDSFGGEERYSMG